MHRSWSIDRMRWQMIHLRIFVVVCNGVEPRASSILGKHSIPEPPSFLLVFTWLKSFIWFVVWLAHFLNYACLRTILNKFIFPVTGRQWSQGTWNVRRKPSWIFLMLRKAGRREQWDKLPEGNAAICIQNLQNSCLLFNLEILPQGNNPKVLILDVRKDLIASGDWLVGV